MQRPSDNSVYTNLRSKSAGVGAPPVPSSQAIAEAHQRMSHVDPGLTAGLVLGAPRGTPETGAEVSIQAGFQEGIQTNIVFKVNQLVRCNSS